MPLVIYGLWGLHTHAHTHTLAPESYFKKPGRRLRPVCAGLKRLPRKVFIKDTASTKPLET